MYAQANASDAELTPEFYVYLPRSGKVCIKLRLIHYANMYRTSGMH